MSREHWAQATVRRSINTTAWATLFFLSATISKVETGRPQANLHLAVMCLRTLVWQWNGGESPYSPYSRRGHIENENEAWLGKPDRKSFFMIRRVMMDREWTTNILLLPPITVALIDYFFAAHRQHHVYLLGYYEMHQTYHGMCVPESSTWATFEQPLNVRNSFALK